MKEIISKLKYIKIHFLVFCLCLLVTYFELISFEKVKSYFINYEYVPKYRKEYSRELQLIYIGSSRCAFSNNKEMYDAVDGIKSLLSEKADSLSIGFTSIGIASDWDPDQGIDHLNKFGYFDEIIVGNNWSNTGVVRYLGEMNGELSTPQILVTLRTYIGPVKAKVSEEKKILTITGMDNIANWFKNGASLPKELIKELNENG